MAHAWRFEMRMAMYAGGFGAGQSASGCAGAGCGPASRIAGLYRVNQAPPGIARGRRTGQRRIVPKRVFLTTSQDSLMPDVVGDVIDVFHMLELKA